MRKKTGISVCQCEMTLAKYLQLHLHLINLIYTFSFYCDRWNLQTYIIIFLVFNTLCSFSFMSSRYFYLIFFFFKKNYIKIVNIYYILQYIVVCVHKMNETFFLQTNKQNNMHIQNLYNFYLNVFLTFFF